MKMEVETIIAHGRRARGHPSCGGAQVSMLFTTLSARKAILADFGVGGGGFAFDKFGDIFAGFSGGYFHLPLGSRSWRTMAANRVMIVAGVLPVRRRCSLLRRRGGLLRRAGWRVWIVADFC
ncbi:MAG: hypothetical protein AUJ92_18585 [Armatimonadetes bacterium CG2_30_59_28]|nr:MAG: hypothetical protein AUJ92_18585 [Armatimonadetes bacterium CG2_30_59_28]